MKRFVLLAAVMLSLWGCATFNRSYKLGNQAELNRNWAEAIRFYEAAALEDPKEPVYRLAMARVKYAASLGYILQGRRLAGEGKIQEALAEYAKARAYDPSNRFLLEEIRRLGETPKQVENQAPEKLELPFKLRAGNEVVTLNFPQETSLRSLFLALGRSAGVNILFDENFRDIPFSINLAEVTFAQALSALCIATKNFYRLIDERSVIIVPDQPMKRIQYEMNAIKTFYLSNIKAEEALQPLQQMISSSFKASKVFADKSLNTITVRDTPETVELAWRLLSQWDKPKAEVLIDLEIMEVSRIRMRQLGLSFDQSIVGLRYGEPPAAGGTSWVNLKDLDFSKAGNFMLTLPLAFLQFLESDADTRIIAQPRLRGLSGEEMKSMVGQKVPIPKTTFAPIAAGGVSQQPITNYDYQDVGIDIKITPQVHLEGEVTLNLELKITSLGGTGVADIPIITTREIKNVLRLRDGETNLLAGLLRDEERKSITGIPGLKSLPLLGRLFSSEDTRLEQTDVILMITPYIIRRVPLTPEDRKALWVDIKEAGAPAGEPQADEQYMERELLSRLRPPRPEEAGHESGNQIVLSPANFELSRNRGEFRITVNIQSAQPVGNLSLNLNFNSQVIKLKDVVEGPLVKQLGENAPFLKNVDNAAGACTIGISSTDLSKGIKAVGNLAVLLFETVNPGETQISIGGVTANGPGGQVVSFTTRNARVVVR
ncbi:MAG: secretin N-terminal domain-containing protein [Candidatus Aminicenantales bacterium]